MAYLFFTRSDYDGHVSKAHSIKRAKLRTSSSKANTPAIPRTPRRKGSVDQSNEKKQKATAKQEVEVVLRVQDSNENIIEPDTNKFIQSDKEENTLQNQVMAKDDTTEIVDSISLPEKDPFPGRYLMESSDKFDDFMKALGVGMIKRKLANSVVPINEVEITEDGLYVIRTLTTVRNTEISFCLNEMFLEDVIDGRRTETTPTRTGNLLRLDQKGQRGGRGWSDAIALAGLEESIWRRRNLCCERNPCIDRYIIAASTSSVNAICVNNLPVTTAFSNFRKPNFCLFCCVLWLKEMTKRAYVEKTKKD